MNGNSNVNKIVVLSLIYIIIEIALFCSDVDLSSFYGCILVNVYVLYMCMCYVCVLSIQVCTYVRVCVSLRYICKNEAIRCVRVCV